MTPFQRLTSVAAPMPDADIDTDIIFPARFLLLTEKTGLGRCAFFDQRHTPGGEERPGFVLNRPPWRDARVLVTGANFGCGSSREQAPWALADLGLRCIVAPSFGDIFRANCYANGLLPVVLGAADHARLMREAEAGREVTVDLVGCAIELGDDGAGAGAAAGGSLRFEVPPRRREALLRGLDEIGQIQRDEAPRIADFEQRQRERMPWLAPAANPDANPSSTNR